MTHPARWSRRQFAQLLGSAGLSTMLGRPARAAEARNRRFVFVFNDGGWDTGHVFTPWWTVNGADNDPAAAPGTAGGISFVDHPSRPQVRMFFEQWGHRTCILNGVEVRSVTHERCRKLVLTGQGALGDDWATLLASHAPQELPLAHVLIDGPAFSQQYTPNVVRIGDENQLPELLSGQALLRSEVPLRPMSTESTALVDAFVHTRAQALVHPLGDAYAQSLERIARLQERTDVDLGVTHGGCERDITADCGLAFTLFSENLSRTAMLRYKGWCAEGWDTHRDIRPQSRNFDDLFGYLHRACMDLSTRQTADGRRLDEDVVFVVFSEMGRAPRLNEWGGRDHWTYTSVMLVGAGIRGGQVLGALDADGRGQPIDLATGEVTASGTPLLPEHLGATLLALGDVDPTPHLGDVSPISAVLA